MGIGKSFCSVAILLYRITLATLLRDPQNFFGLSKGVNIIYGILSVTKESVRQTAFGDALNFMSHSGYFINELHFDPNALYSKGIIPFRSGIYLTAGSKSWHILGRNVLGVLLDEGNVRLEQNPDQSAYNLYGEIRTRIVNRFQKVEGHLPAISLIASSASDESSFTERLIKEIDEARTPSTQKVYRGPVYKIKRHELSLGKRWFRVAYGLKNQEPVILSGWFLEDGKLIETDGVAEDAPPGTRTELVPEMYWPDFRRNCRQALKDISGISTSGTHRLFPTMIDFERCLALSEQDGVRNPVKGNVRYIPISKDDDQNIWDYLDHNTFLTRVQSVIRPLRHPNSKRYGHLDLATQSKAGLSICHLVGATKVEGVAISGHPFDEYRLIVEYDFILTITAGPVSSISFNKICNFFYWLKNMCGFQFGKVTADMFQSHQTLEGLDSAGIPTELLSLDRDKTVYLSWRSGVEDHRLRLYRQAELMEEAEDLQEGDKKFDHLPLKSKDTSDSCVTLDTEVQTLDGKVVKIGDLIPGEKCWVYALNESREVVAAEATALGVTRKNAAIIRVTLDNGATVSTTEDHLFMLRDGSYLPASKLTVSTRLMPFYFRRHVQGYGKVFNPGLSKYEFVYRIVDRQLRGHKPKGYAVHHKDHNKCNDRPGNLERMLSSAHWALHRNIKLPDGYATEQRRLSALEAHNSNPAVKAKQAERMRYAGQFSKDRTVQMERARERIATPEWQAQHSKTMKQKCADNPAYRKRLLENIKIAAAARKIALTAEQVAVERNKGTTNLEIAEKYGVGVWTVERRAKEARQAGMPVLADNKCGRHPSQVKERNRKLAAVLARTDAGMSVYDACSLEHLAPQTFKEWLKKHNHAVISIEKAGFADVTCLRVEKHENFAVLAGVFIHNCAGAYFNAITSDERTTLLTEATPSVYTQGEALSTSEDRPVMDIPLPPKVPRPPRDHHI